MHELLKDSEIELDLPVKPRKLNKGDVDLLPFREFFGVQFLLNISSEKQSDVFTTLLVIENFKSFNLNHGLMEAGYVNHESAILSSNSSDSETRYDANAVSISMTATMDMSGRLVLGSSRQLIGFNTEIDESIIHRIWERAGEFFPILNEISLRDLTRNREVRVGLRPYMPGGKPVIGSVPGLSKTFLATGHEGEGLSLAWGTAEMIFNMVLENPQNVNPMPLSL